jgi:polyhydroxybutyrate depolymerase
MLLINSRRAKEPDVSGPGEWARADIATAAATLNFWRRNNGCEGPPQVRMMPDKEPQDGSTIAAEQHLICSSGATVVSFMSESASLLPPGAKVPNGSPLVALTGGRPNADISSADIVWKFFRRFPAQ